MEAAQIIAAVFIGQVFTTVITVVAIKVELRWLRADIDRIEKLAQAAKDQADEVAQLRNLAAV